MNRILEIIKNNVNVDEVNAGALAYVGDCVYEIYVRTKITLEAQRKVKDLNKEAMKYVKASMQAESYKDLEEYLTDSEIEIYKRGRNHKGGISSKSATVTDYRMATGFEALLGYLFLKGEMDRLDEIMKIVFDKKDERLESIITKGE